MIQAVAFLGNPGAEYERTRHNTAWLLIPHLPFAADLSWQKKFKGSVAARVAPRTHFLKPETFMNASGDSLAALAAFYHLEPSELLVVHDELELPLGTVSLKAGGGLGGHNGLRSCKARLGSADFWRLRLGIGRPDDRRPGEGGEAGSGRGILEWVLSPWSASEEAILSPTLAAAAAILTEVLETEDAATLFPRYAKFRATP